MSFKLKSVFPYFILNQIIGRICKSYPRITGNGWKDSEEGGETWTTVPEGSKRICQESTRAAEKQPSKSKG